MYHDPVHVSPQRKIHVIIGLLLTAFATLFAIFWIIFWLNYFTIFRIYEFFPGLSFLPRQKATEYSEIQQKTSIKSQYNIVCPTNSSTAKSFCAKGQEVFKNGQYIGWGGKVAKDTKIIAALSGKIYINTLTLENEEFTELYITNGQDIVRYLFKGYVLLGDTVKIGDAVADTSGAGISFYGNLPLIFSYAREFKKSELEEAQFPLISPVWLRIQSYDFVTD